jgi:membrane associated rhomboid family serine protease
MAIDSYKSPKSILLGEDNNNLVLLFAVNTLLFLIFASIKVFYFLTDTPIEFFYRQVLNWFTLSPVPDIFFSRPWTFITAMFTHSSVWHLISTILWLWAFGYILQDLAGNNRLIPLYLYGGFIGAIVFVTCNNLFPVLERNIANTAAFMGGGAAVMTIAVATTTLAPDYRLFPLINGGIPLWVLTLIFVAIDFATLASSNGGIAAAHLVGGAFGFVFMKQLQKGNDWSAWMIQFTNWVDDLFSPEKKHAQKKHAEKHFYRTNRKPYEKITSVTQQKLDAILDKINQHGYAFLSDEEKAFLQRASDQEEL